MYGKQALALMAALVVAACGGNDGGVENTGTPSAAADTALDPPPGTVDSAGVGTNPPTAGGSLVDTAAVPGQVDTAQGTPTAP